MKIHPSKQLNKTTQSPVPVQQEQQNRSHLLDPATPLSPAVVLQLQKTIGNHAVMQFLKLQKKASDFSQSTSASVAQRARIEGTDVDDGLDDTMEDEMLHKWIAAHMEETGKILALKQFMTQRQSQNGQLASGYELVPKEVKVRPGKSTVSPAISTSEETDKALSILEPDLESASKGFSVPKDLSVKPKAMHMTWLYSEGETGAKYIEQMAQIGLIEGYRVVVQIDKKSASSLQHMVSKEAMGNIELAITEKIVGKWAEDSGDFHTDDSLHVPAPFDDRMVDSTGTIEKSRRERGYYADPSDKNHEHLGKVGTNVAQSGIQKDKVALAISQQRKIYKDMTHIEGGNFLNGTLLDGMPYALVGQDGIEVTRQLIALQNSCKASEVPDEVIRKFLSADKGIPPEAIHFIEQPGEFHLDMSMVLMGAGQVLINDSLAVYALQEQWMTEDLLKAKPAESNLEATVQWELARSEMHKELAKLKGNALKMYTYELKVMNQLKKLKHLSVSQVGGSFPQTIKTPAMNFLNGEGGIGADGTPFFVTNGGWDPRAEAYIAQQYLQVLGTGIQRLYFLDPKASSKSLAEFGGLGCRTKIEGSAGKHLAPSGSNSSDLSWNSLEFSTIQLGFTNTDSQEIAALAVKGLKGCGIEASEITVNVGDGVITIGHTSKTGNIKITIADSIKIEVENSTNSDATSIPNKDKSYAEKQVFNVFNEGVLLPETWLD